MKVFKFGGASVSSVERIKQVGTILSAYDTDKIVIVVSAMGKTTNALEKVVDSFYKGEQAKALQLFQEIKSQHLQTAKALLTLHYLTTEQLLMNFFIEVEWLLHDRPVKSFDYYYDQVVCVGELLSSAILSASLRESNINNAWVDVRDIIRTDDNFRDATLDWPATQKNVDEVLRPLLEDGNLIITQGFIGATGENESTTLGREGSDYSAAILANMLNASSLTIWKDVEGIMNADPKEFPDAQYLPYLDYEEVIEMAYYGAQVIHPKTIKPLQNKNIPMNVKCFINMELPGTIIHSGVVKDLPPILVIKKSQVLLHLRSTDFSFVGEKPLAELYHLFEELKIKPNLIQTGAVTVQVCFDEHPEKIEKLASAASASFEVQLEKGLTLITIRHDNGVVMNQVLKGREPELSQRAGSTTQVLVR